MVAILSEQLKDAIESDTDVDEIAGAIGASRAVIDAMLAEDGKAIPISVADRLATFFGLRLANAEEEQST